MTDTILPAALRDPVMQYLQQFRDACAARDLIAEIGSELVTRAFVCSEFIAHNCIRHPLVLAELLDSGDLRAHYDAATLAKRLAQQLTDVANEASLMQRLRQIRRREMVRIAWRDVVDWADLNETMRDLSSLADACIDLALRHLERFAIHLWGTPSNTRGEPQHLVVIAMGKLGAGELNFSSDVDLIFAYPEDGETRGAARSTSNGEFFMRLGQQLINTLSQSTADGFVFRVDVRLRPFGDSGALAMEFDATEQYYQEHGREWERYALVKARICAGDLAAGERLLSSLAPFVYRRYLDFGAFESLREMKRMINQEVKRKGFDANVKLGPGGIREIEFIGQAFQLIRGGRQPLLRERRIQQVLNQLRDANYLPDYVVRELQDAYVFLRNSEHRIQEYADQQTHNLPSDALGRARLAYALGFTEWLAYEITLRKHMQRVHNHFEQVFAAPQAETAAGDAALEVSGLWNNTLPSDARDQVLTRLGFTELDRALEVLAQLRRSSAFRASSSTGQQRLDQLIPLVLGAVGKSSNAEDTLQRILRLIESVARRTAYLALLVENPMALSQLVKLCSASAWIAELLSRHPVLLDELLDPRSLYTPPDAQALRAELTQRLAAIAPDDLEQQMEALRQFKQANVLRVAAADIADALPLMVVSDHLSWIAEAVIAAVLDLAWRELTARHGAPSCYLDGARCERGFAVVAYGKLGGLELGYGSDLDLVFLHADTDQEQLTPGEKPISSAIFFARLAQRIVHMFTAHTPSGVLYDVDLRLRPSGASGLLVSTLDAYAEYQTSEAWTWEHQALVRARPVAGDPVVAQRFATIRHEILIRNRDLTQLRSDVLAMREKMRSTFANPGVGKYDLKQGYGGIVDIEFLVQYGVLAWAHEHTALLDFTDNIRLLGALGDAKKLGASDVQMLCDAYRSYRARQHKLALQSAPAVIAVAEFQEFRAAVLEVWRKLLEPG
jgi:glutamate-ammonia-ligase adenylyltransferase